jgi:uncharacterized phage protein (TIGR01671 family)
MNREIKFRAKRLDNGEWAYGSGVVFCDDFCFLDKNDECYIEELYTFRGNTHFIKLACIQCDDKTIGQYTGLKDKSGKEIYEGDIVKSIGGKIGYVVFLAQEMVYVVVWDNCDTRLGHRNRGGGYGDDLSIEVIGNVCDNEELLKK